MKLKIRFQILFLAFAAANVSPCKSTTRDENKFSFSYPPKWVQTQDKKQGNCIFLRERKNRFSQDSEKWEVKICNHVGTLDEILSLTVFFKDKNKWMASGSMDEQPATTIPNRFTTFSLETKIPPTCGISDEESGFHAAGGQCYSAIASCKNDHISIETNGMMGNFRAAQKIARSIVFKACQKN